MPKFRSLRSRTLRALASAAVLALVATGLPLWRLATEKQAGMELTQVRDRSDTMTEAFDALVNMETGVRGYLYSRDSRYLEPYYLGLEQFNQVKPKLKKLEQSNHGKDVELLEKLAAQQFAVSRYLISNPGGELPLDRQKQLMDAKRQILSRIQEEEDKERLTLTQQRRNRWKGDAIMLSTVSLSVVCLLWLVGKGILEMDALQQQARASCDLDHQARQLSEELASTKSQILSTLSHEIGTPLTQVRMALEAIKNRVADEALTGYLTIGIEGVRRLAQISADVLQLERLYSEPELQMSVVELSGWCFELALELDIERIVVQVAPQHYATDVILLRLALKNLLVNALKYSDRAVLFSSVKGVDSHSFVIKDSGRGIPSQQLEKIFEPFVRGQSVGLIPGTGLGLAIAKRAIERLGGEIVLESVEGEGTTAIVRLLKAVGKS